MREGAGQWGGGTNLLTLLLALGDRVVLEDLRENSH